MIRFIIWKRNWDKSSQKNVYDLFNKATSLVYKNKQKAMEIFERYMNYLKEYIDKDEYDGCCELFIPHVKEDGEFMPMPERANCIKRFSFTSCLNSIDFLPPYE
jgi:hypothetical protein